ncbi:MAG: DNA-binding winged helix-turn-helix (wHTH) protein, partial [Candidatus Krumholzibacteriia bacterium]
MNHPETFRPPFRLNQWLVQPDLNRISGPDGTTQVEPRVMAVLLALAQRPGDVLTRL